MRPISSGVDRNGRQSSRFSACVPPIRLEVRPAMGLMRLIVHDRDRIPPGGLEHVHMCGQDDLPWFGRAYFSGNQLIIERNEERLRPRASCPGGSDDGGPLLIGTVDADGARRGRTCWKSSWPAAWSTASAIRLPNGKCWGWSCPTIAAQQGARSDQRVFARGHDAERPCQPPPSGPSGRSSRPSTRWTRWPTSMSQQAIEHAPRAAAAVHHLVWRPPGRPAAASRTSRGKLSAAFNMVSRAAHVADDRGRRRPPQLEARPMPRSNGPTRPACESCGGPLLGARRSRRARLDLSVGRRLRQPAGVHARPRARGRRSAIAAKCISGKSPPA